MDLESKEHSEVCDRSSPRNSHPYDRRHDSLIAFLFLWTLIVWTSDNMSVTGCPPFWYPRTQRWQGTQRLIYYESSSLCSHENENEQSVIFYDESSARPALLKRSHEVGQPVRVLLQGLHQQIDAVETIVIVQE